MRQKCYWAIVQKQRIARLHSYIIVSLYGLHLNLWAHRLSPCGCSPTEAWSHCLLLPDCHMLVTTRTITRTRTRTRRKKIKTKNKQKKKKSKDQDSRPRPTTTTTTTTTTTRNKSKTKRNKTTTKRRTRRARTRQIKRTRRNTVEGKKVGSEKTNTTRIPARKANCCHPGPIPSTSESGKQWLSSASTQAAKVGGAREVKEKSTCCMGLCWRRVALEKYKGEVKCWP